MCRSLHLRLLTISSNFSQVVATRLTSTSFLKSLSTVVPQAGSTIRLLAVYTVFAFSAPAASDSRHAARTEESKIAITDAFDVIRIIQYDTERIRFEMGKPKDDHILFNVSDASPRHVLFQAHTLCDGVNRLGYELTREQGKMPPVPPNQIETEDITVFLDYACAELKRIIKNIGLHDQMMTDTNSEPGSLSDLLLAIAKTKQQINVLLGTRFAPKDVYQQVTSAIDYASLILGQFPDTVQIPESPPFERAKSPEDVYLRLVDCLRIVSRIVEQSGIDTVRLQEVSVKIDQVFPRDVLDIATLITAELAYLHTKSNKTDPPRDAFDPGVKFPSHVFQRAGILLAQLTELEEQIRVSPRWLHVRSQQP